MPSLKTDALAACEAAVASIGFRRRRGSLLQERGDGVDGWLGFNVATFNSSQLIEVNPVVGVRFSRLEGFRRELEGYLPKQPIPSISKPLRSLVPERPSWEFRQGVDSEIIAASLAAALREYGEPYIAMYSDWGFYSGEVAKPGVLPQWEYAKVLPIVNIINEDSEGAWRVIESELMRVGDAGDVYSNSYREYAEKFFAKFGLFARIYFTRLGRAMA